jgi:hypothetical protein
VEKVTSAEEDSLTALPTYDSMVFTFGKLSELAGLLSWKAWEG